MTTATAASRAEAIAELGRDLAIGQAPDSPAAGVAAILADLAEYIGATAGDLSPKALDEIAAAYLAGARDSTYRADDAADVRRAYRVAMPILDAINRTA